MPRQTVACWGGSLVCGLLLSAVGVRPLMRARNPSMWMMEIRLGLVCCGVDTGISLMGIPGPRTSQGNSHTLSPMALLSEKNLVRPHSCWAEPDILGQWFLTLSRVSELLERAARTQNLEFVIPQLLGEARALTSHQCPEDTNAAGLKTTPEETGPWGRPVSAWPGAPLSSPSSVTTPQGGISRSGEHRCIH